MRIPGDEQIRAWHQRFAPSEAAFDLVWTHCRIVCALAEELCASNGLEVDLDLVRAGCLLHDIGVYRLRPGEHYIRHGVLGRDLLGELGLPGVLRRFCAHHTGVGISGDDIVEQGLPLPAGDYLAETAEEEIVMYADKFHSKSTPPSFVSAESYARRVGRFGAGKAERFAEMRQRFGEPDLAAMAKRFGHDVA